MNQINIVASNINSKNQSSYIKLHSSKNKSKYQQT